MTDQFLVNFALVTLVGISFGLQHSSQYLIRNIKRDNKGETNMLLVISIMVMQLLSIGIIVEIVQYALKK